MPSTSSSTGRGTGTGSGSGAVPGSPVTPPRLRSPLARAVVPVLGGIGVIALIFLATWGVAAWTSRGGADSTARLAPTTFEMGSVEARARSVAEDGPILFPDLNTNAGTRTLVVDHEGEDPASGWRVYWAYPADRDPTCVVEQIRHTSTFTDCDGREVDVTELAAPPDVHPVVTNSRTLSIDLRDAVATTDDATETVDTQG
ncbi:MAG: hypothetical protein ABW219_14420 [Ilumatobacteraceae bacterium]